MLVFFLKLPAQLKYLQISNQISGIYFKKLPSKSPNNTGLDKKAYNKNFIHITVLKRQKIIQKMWVA